jgi:hypothetical protein
MKGISKFVQDELKWPRCNLQDVIVSGGVVELGGVGVGVGVIEDIVKATHGALLVYSSQSPVKAMPAFRMVW